MNKNLLRKSSAIFLGLCISLGAVGLVTPELGNMEAQAATTKPIALVYRGPVAGCDECSEAVAALLESDTNWDFDVRYVGPNESLTVQNGLKLAGAVLYAQPGGDGDLDSAYNKISGNVSAVQSFVQNGGRYLGFCMGGYLVDDDPGYGLGIDTDQYITSAGAQTTYVDS